MRAPSVRGLWGGPAAVLGIRVVAQAASLVGLLALDSLVSGDPVGTLILSITVSQVVGGAAGVALSRPLTRLLAGPNPMWPNIVGQCIAKVAVGAVLVGAFANVGFLSGSDVAPLFLFLQGLVATLGVLVSNVAAGILLARRSAWVSAIAEFGTGTLSVVGCVASVTFDPGAQGLLAVRAFVLCVAATAVCVPAWKAIRGLRRTPAANGFGAEVSAMLRVSSSNLLMQRLDVLVLGLFASQSTAGSYGIVQRLCELVKWPANAYYSTRSPSIAAASLSGDTMKVQAVSQDLLGALRRVLAIGALWILLLSVASPAILEPDLHIGVVPVLGLAAMVATFQGALVTLLVMSGEGVSASTGVSRGVVVLVACLFPLAWLGEDLGAAIAALTAMSASAFLLSARWSTHLGVTPVHEA